MLADDLAAVALEAGSLGERLRQQETTLVVIHRIADISLIIGCLFLAASTGDTPFTPAVWIAGVIGAVLFHILGTLKGLYRPWRTESIRAQLWSVLEIWLGVTGASLVCLYVQQGTVAYPPETFLLWLVGTPFVLLAWRFSATYTAHRLRARGYNLRRLAIAGSGELAEHLARTVEANKWMGLRNVGLFDESSPSGGTPGRGTRLSGSLDDLARLAREGEVEVIYLALPPGASQHQTDALLRQLGDTTASVYLVQDRRSRNPGSAPSSRQVLPDLCRVDVLHRRIVDIAGIKAVSIYESPFLGPDGWLKRLQDIFVSTVALLLLAAPMAAIAVGVKLTGPGPVFFKQRRYGLDGRQILVWKFRSMTVCEDTGNIAQARKGDARITPFGRFLRRTSLDELPQFFNVLAGDMSIVGPRPHAVAHNEHYRRLIGGYMLRHKVKPGITGWAQVNGWRGETDSVDKMGRRVDFDLDYIRNWSLWLDIQIILMTFLKGFVHRNAY